MSEMDETKVLYNISRGHCGKFKTAAFDELPPDGAVKCEWTVRWNANGKGGISGNTRIGPGSISGIEAEWSVYHWVWVTDFFERPITNILSPWFRLHSKKDSSDFRIITHKWDNMPFNDSRNSFRTQSGSPTVVYLMLHWKNLHRYRNSRITGRFFVSMGDPHDLTKRQYWTRYHNNRDRNKEQILGFDLDVAQHVGRGKEMHSLLFPKPDSNWKP